MAKKITRVGFEDFRQCFICREWSWDVSRSFSHTRLCLPCYVDVLEVRQRRGVSLETAEPVEESLREGPDQSSAPSHPFPQLNLFD